MSRSDVLAIGITLVAMGAAFVIGLFGAVAAIVVGAAFLFLYYFMWRSEDGNELLHVVESVINHLKSSFSELRPE